MSSWNCWENPSKCLPRFSKQKYPINMWFWNCIIQKRMHGLVGQGTRHKTQSEKRKAKIRTWILRVHLCEYAQIRYTVNGTHGQLRNTMGASETSITGTPRFFFWMVKIKSELNWFFKYRNREKMGKCAVCCEITWLMHVMAQKNSKDYYTNFNVAFGSILVHFYFFWCTYIWVMP